MKINFAKPGEEIRCEVCWAFLGDSGYDVSEDGSIDDYWCETCMDFRGGAVVPKYLG